MTSKPLKDKGILLEVVEKAIEARGSEVEIKYRDRLQQVFGFGQGIGVGIASLDSKCEQARSLRKELFRIRFVKK
jgi:hypothetical protein